MKKYLLAILVIMLMIALTACAKDPDQSSAVSPSVIEFTDKQLEGRIRSVLNKPDGEISLEEAAVVTALDLSNESFDDMNTKDGGIKDISTLQYFPEIIELNLSFNSITDLTPLSGLKKLETLVISGTQVEDLAPLKESQSMKCLVFCWLHGDNGTPRGIGSLDALAGMQSLEHIDAKNAGITDISALAGLPKLWDVQLNDNEISDISPLENVKTLKIVLLAENPIKDFSPLKDIYHQLEGKDFEIN